MLRRHGKAVLRRCGSILRDAAEAEDAAQEVMTMLATEGHRYRGEAAVSTWLYRVTTNICLNRLRAAGRRRARERSGEVAAWLTVPPATPFERVSARVTLEEVLSRLDDLGKQVFVYRYLDGLTQEEIAEVTEYSRKTIGLRLQEIEAQLKAAEESR